MSEQIKFKEYLINKQLKTSHSEISDFVLLMFYREFDCHPRRDPALANAKYH